MLVELYAKKGTYKKDGEDRPFTNYYVKCGETLVPIEPKYFGSDEKPDKKYLGRKSVLTAFAAPLPEKE